MIRGLVYLLLVSVGVHGFADEQGSGVHRCHGTQLCVLRKECKGLNKVTIEREYSCRPDDDRDFICCADQNIVFSDDEKPVKDIRARDADEEEYGAVHRRSTDASGRSGDVAPSSYGYSAPAPSYGYSAPAPSYGYPAPSYGYSAPSPSYGYSAPSPSYGYSAPSPSYGYSAPSPSYGYSAPSPSYGYSAPSPSYGYSAPSPSYGYSAPSPSYGYSAPSPSYGYGYQPVSSYGYQPVSSYGGYQPVSSYGYGGSHQSRRLYYSDQLQIDGCYGRELSWEYAKNCCERAGLEIAVVQDAYEFNAIAQEMRSRYIKHLWVNGVRSHYNPYTFVTDKGQALPYLDWSPTGGYGRPQPDNREGNENCLAILNDTYNDGIKNHDIACHHQKAAVCVAPSYL